MLLPASHVRPLYIQSPAVRRLDLDAARRLRVERSHQPDVHIPLHHVSRIVCSANIDVAFEVVIACMQGGIPIVLTDKSGDTVGWCIGQRRKETTLKQLLIHALDDPAWEALYNPWFDNQKKAVAAQVLMFCAVQGSAKARRNPRAALCNAHQKKFGQACTLWVDQYASLGKQALVAALEKEIGDPALLAWRRPGLNLMEDLGSIIGLHAHTDIHHAQQLPAPEKAQAWAVRLHEAHMAHWQQRIAYLMVAFEQFLRSHWL